MGLFGNACRETWETAKGVFREAVYDAPIIGFVPKMVNVTIANVLDEWEEVKTPRGFFGTASRGREIGAINANRPDIQIMGVSDGGFYVKKGQKQAAIDYLESVNLKAE